MSRRGDSPEQRLRTAELRAVLGREEHPDWSATEIAEEYGTFSELVVPPVRAVLSTKQKLAKLVSKIKPNAVRRP